MSQLSQPTRDLNQARADLDEFGYALVAQALTPIQVSAMRERLEDQAAAEKRQGLAFEDGGAKQQWGEFRNERGELQPAIFTEEEGGVNQRVWMLINKGRVFREVLSIKPVRALIDHILGDHYLLSSFGANIAKPGGVAMDLHTDQWWMPEPVRSEGSEVPAGSITRNLSNGLDTEDAPLIAPVTAVNVMWMLNDFTEENGGTRLVPGSHRFGRRPNKKRDAHVSTIAAEAPAGTAVIFDGRIWHGTGANASEGSRLGLLTTFCGPQFRTQENYTVGIAREVLDEASPDLLALLGLKIWNGYGRIESPTAGFIEPGEASFGELSLEDSS
jgi:ectoine hydroxylase-related dioxygenase (phytanoyl-CoA dioxygenase family)